VSYKDAVCSNTQCRGVSDAVVVAAVLVIVAVMCVVVSMANNALLFFYLFIQFHQWRPYVYRWRWGLRRNQHRKDWGGVLLIEHRVTAQERSLEPMSM
jgi:hypothetical protein